jgi:DNA repair protein RadC
VGPAALIIHDSARLPKPGARGTVQVSEVDARDTIEARPPGTPAPERRGGNGRGQAHQPGADGSRPDGSGRSLRPREKLRARGPAGLADAELLALVLGSGVTGRSALRIGRHLARRSPAELGGWSSARWLLIPGVGPARAAALVAAFELGRRAAEGAPGGAAIRSPEDVLGQVRDLARARKEHFVVLLLNARHEMQCRETVSIGSLNASIVHPREVFQPAILHSAAAVVLVHNHPSGDPEPSEEDLSITKRLVQVGEVVGIAVLDHVIVAGRGLVSMRARQLL